MEIALGIAVLLVCMCGGAEAQHSLPQQVRYDGEPSSNSHEPLASPPQMERSPPPPEGFHPTGVQGSGKLHYSVKNPMRGNPYSVQYREPESSNSYHSQPEDQQWSPLHRPSHASVIHPAAQEQLGYQSPPERLSHMSVIYPKAAAQDQPEYQTGPEQLEHPPHRPSHSAAAHEPQPPSPKLPDHHPNQPDHSRVVRDPRLPLYFTMYEKRIVQDPVDKYGKGPWRYLTYGHGITYGSKEPGKVFERGYGYIRALGRDHCKLPENRCPRRDDGKPFRYEGRKEPYFGYRPH